MNKATKFCGIFPLLFHLVFLISAQDSLTGDCVWYGAEGEIAEGANVYCENFKFSRYAMATAHFNVPNMKCGTKLRVTNLSNGKTVDVIVNDKGPNDNRGRILDLTWAAWDKIEKHDKGVTRCSYTVIG